MNTEILQTCLHGAFSGTMTFGETIGHMLSTGVEWYSANLIIKASTHYFPDCSYHQARWPDWECPAISPTFDSGKVLAAIRSVQRREIIYPGFLDQIAAAGVTYYTVHLQGRKAIYFGRHGDSYTEPFPQV